MSTSLLQTYLLSDPTPTHHAYTHTHTHTHLRLTHTLTEEKYKREVVVIPVDFSDGMDICPNIAEQLQDLDIGVLSKLFAMNSFHF